MKNFCNDILYLKLHYDIGWTCSRIAAMPYKGSFCPSHAWETKAVYSTARLVQLL